MKLRKILNIFIFGTFVIGHLPALAQETDTYVQCEDTCRHIHGIDLSHYQGEVFGKPSVTIARWLTSI